LFVATPALALTNNVASTNRSFDIPSAPSEQFENQTNQNQSSTRRVEEVRMDCIQHRRIICGKIVKVLPDGLVVDSGYTNLMRPPLNLSWVVPGTVTSRRAANMVEGNQPESVCIGLVFLTGQPKKPVPKLYDYINLVGYPMGQYTYTSVGDVHRTVRRFSAKLANAVQWKLDEQEKQSAPLK
jgi:hypothetical protein